MSYEPYKLHIHGSKSYYTLLALPQSSSLSIIKQRIHCLQSFVDTDILSNNNFYNNQISDLTKIKNTFKNLESKQHYDQSHHFAEYSINKNIFVMLLYYTS